MVHIAIVGAGIGGLPAAYELRELLGGRNARITLIDKKPDFQFVPSNPWVAVGWRVRKDISIELAPLLKKKGINFITGEVRKIEPESNQLTLHDGGSVTYDYLVICTGPRLAFELIDGLGPQGFTHSICTTAHAERCYEDVKRLIENPGPVIIGAAQGASCFGPAYEYAFILDKALRDKKVRKDVAMTYVTSEPYIGHLGLGGVGDSKSLLESELRQRHINWVCNAQIHSVAQDTMAVEELKPDGTCAGNHTLPFKHAMVLPAFRGIEAIAAAPALGNDKGFVPIDDYQRHPKYNNIYSAGVCVAIPPVEATPVPVGTPKTGYMIESMVTALAQNIKADINGEKPTAQATWNAICLADMGDSGAAFVALPQIPPRNITWMKKGNWVHTAKIAFEKYFIKKMKAGKTEPLYERLILKFFGVEKLENKQ
ncbi:NAD(P)/FAD-dependent oxidoreductase [Exilibacterium tricleocarpae]|uniref:Sulfide-quinone reductase n=1 Tax=Exilibacterium tricleocarpae TaxID=2591008 RepID=A0A545TAA8_9GAMM|nr:FAD/NAD(P)-binding oxidoreductase [Exilibacterium tricleocarpae]TQV74153.1 NAD(P)/FAD-dependent oxidoreductase [Exilibacterium tricleocarpae]